MKKISRYNSAKNALFAFALLSISLSPVIATADPGHRSPAPNSEVVDVKLINPTTVELRFSDKQKMTLDFYGETIFRLFQDTSGGFIRKPEAEPDANILVTNPRRPVSGLVLDNGTSEVSISTTAISFVINKKTGLFKVINRKTKAVVLEESSPVNFGKDKITVTLKELPQEYFYGGGIQNGRFSHKGKSIAIENKNSWTDGGVASPNPFYWSTNGYAVMFYTFKRGKYDFGAKQKGTVELFHETNYLDAFFMVGDGAAALLSDYYQLTGNPALLPKFAFYEGHLNAYNRDFWKEDTAGILFEDGKRYKEGKDNTGTKESLNGEKNNYQFSARAVIDRYKQHDMPFGWILPNDGYGAGYGQTETLEGNVENLKNLGDYARKNGVQIGLWTQSDLHPKLTVAPLLQRDIIREVRDAGVRVLKTDVAWVGRGYSFGLNGISDVGQIIPYYGNDARPFIISLDGWSGTQRYAAVWSGDQTGGVWEYIRFHIPTYIGSGLSGEPNITSDMDGIFGGKNPAVNIRDFQWKTFTPVQLNMDGWGSNPKYPHILGEPAASINRNYLKLKSQLIPYTYSVAREAVNGLPIIRAMFLEYPNEYTLGTATKYQFMYGPNFLVAPIYQETKADKNGNDIRNGIYLPKGNWIDYLSGEVYEGDRILNSFAAPIWKLPFFVKNGAIIPLTNPNNNVTEINKSQRTYELYPYGKSAFTEYDDDGTTESYKLGKGATTKITTELDAKGTVSITINPTEGDFNGFVKVKATEIRVNLSQAPTGITARIGTKPVVLKKAASLQEFEQGTNVYFYNKATEFNRFSTKGSDFEKVNITRNPQALIKLAAADISATKIAVQLTGYVSLRAEKSRVTSGSLTAPANAGVRGSNVQAFTLTPSWKEVDHADFYEIEFNNMLYTTIRDTSLLFDGLTPETAYSFRLRAANKDGYSPWGEIKATTKADPVQFAIRGIAATTTAQSQGRGGTAALFDIDEMSQWSTARNTTPVPFDMILDLKGVNKLDALRYVPRGAGNGALLKGKVFVSSNKESWTETGSFDWANTPDAKDFRFTSQPTARFIKISIGEAVGNMAAGRELYVFKVPGTESQLVGDINNDKVVDDNDFTSYANYTGLRKGDGDFEGYISKGDINNNNAIDAFDISNVATQLDGGIRSYKIDSLSGSLTLTVPKQDYNAGEIVEITVKGQDLRDVNAFGFALPYNQQDYEFVGIDSQNTKDMENLTNDRLHSNNEKVLYPTFVNIGNNQTLRGSENLFVIKLKTKRKLSFALKLSAGMLVDKNLNTVSF